MSLVLTRVLGQLSRTSTGANLEGSRPTEMLCQLGLVRRVPNQDESRTSDALE